MSAFLTRLFMVKIGKDDGPFWALTRPLVYYSVVAGRRFKVPAGFVTDLATVPRMPFVFLLTGDTSREASALHDWLYTAPHPVDRATADKVLREASAVTGVPAWRRTLMYWGVRLFGAAHW
jgi:hypothetical protein